MMANVRGRPGGRQAGLSLVEIMVAMVAGLILLGGAFQVFLSVKQTWRVQESLARLQENGRFATLELSKSVRMAGFAGCVMDINNLLDPAGTGYSDALFDFDRPVSGWEAAGTAPDDDYTITGFDPAGAALSGWDDAAGQDLSVYLKDLVVPGTDVIVVRRAERITGVTATGNTPANASAINLDGPSGVTKGAIVLVSDCSGADVFQSTANTNGNTLTFGASGTPGNLPAANLSHQYGEDMEIHVLAIDAYYIGIGFAGRPSLFRMRFSAGLASAPVGEELVEGVDSIQWLYGEDSDDDDAVDAYVTADAVSDWDNIIAMRAAMLVTSTDTALTDARDEPFTVNGADITPPADLRQRQVFTTTIALRNRLP